MSNRRDHLGRSIAVLVCSDWTLGLRTPDQGAPPSLYKLDVLLGLRRRQSGSLYWCITYSPQRFRPVSAFCTNPNPSTEQSIQVLFSQRVCTTSRSPEVCRSMSSDRRCYCDRDERSKPVLCRRRRLELRGQGGWIWWLGWICERETGALLVDGRGGGGLLVV